MPGFGLHRSGTQAGLVLANGFIEKRFVYFCAEDFFGEIDLSGLRTC
jgi:hypothetical protein